MRLTLTIALALCAVTGSARAEAPAPIAVQPEARWFPLGGIRLAALHDANLAIANDGKTFGVDVGASKVAALLAKAGKPTNRIAVSINALLVRMPGRLVLIDTGIGDAGHGQLIASAARAGVAPGDVTDVLLTHSHGDHVGGLATAAGTLAFPKATIRMAAAEWQSMRGQAGAAKLVKAIDGHVETFVPGIVVVPGITAIAIPGHTPGHVGYEIVSRRARLFDIGDAAHSTLVSLTEPDWGMGFDNDREVGRRSRRATLARLSRSHELVFSPHFPYPGVGQIIQRGAGYGWQPAKL